MAPFRVEPPKDHEAPVGENGRQFPYCCEYHTGLLNDVTEWFTLFPNCCERHQKMAKGRNFRKQNYPDVPIKVVSQVSYPEYHIRSVMEAEDRYDDITEYIEYNLKSFGHPAAGVDKNYGTILRHVQNKDLKIPQHKRKRLIEYLNAQAGGGSKNKVTSLNVLYAIYQKWLKIFPFGLEVFAELKAVFEKTLPIIDGELHYNRYLDLTRGKVVTPSVLIGTLIGLTKKILDSIDTAALFERGMITDAGKQLLDLVNVAHRIKQTSLLGDYTKTEVRYATVVKQWLENEKDYFKDILPLFERAEAAAKPQDPIHVKLREALQQSAFAFGIPAW